jgi:hypothetical protein
MGFLQSSILNKFFREIDTFVLFYKAWHSFPLFLSQTMANRILWVPTNLHIPWRSAFFLFFFPFFWKITIWKIENPTTTSRWVENSVTKWEVFWRFFLKGSTWKFTWNGLKIPCIGIYSGLFGITWLLVVRCMRSIPSQYRWRLPKDLERPTKRAIMAIIMHSDKTLLTKS